MNGRYFLDISYQGSAYHGWQIQQNALSIQEVLEKGIEKIMGQHVETTASGRTDTGVHALQQYVHLDIHKEIEMTDFVHKLNAVLPKDIAIKSIHKVRDDANARFHAVSRSYEYRMHCHKNPFLQGLSYYFPYSLDLHKMNEACKHLLGEKDFQSFSKVKTDVTHFRCVLSEAEWSSSDNKYLFSISANRFLRGMVRAIVGTLIEVGKGALSLKDFQQILDYKDRREAGRAVPACGLYLSHIQYPNDIFCR